MKQGFTKYTFLGLIGYMALGLVLLTAINGCKRKGCTQSCALNFDAKAEKDDGSCIESKPTISFWSNGNSHGYIKIAVDFNRNDSIDVGEYCGTLAFGFNEEPFCGQYNLVSAEVHQAGNYRYRAWADDGKEWVGYQDLDFCECRMVFLPN